MRWDSCLVLVVNGLRGELGTCDRDELLRADDRLIWMRCWIIYMYCMEKLKLVNVYARLAAHVWSRCKWPEICWGWASLYLLSNSTYIQCSRSCTARHQAVQWLKSNNCKFATVTYSRYNAAVYCMWCALMSVNVSALLDLCVLARRRGRTLLCSVQNLNEGQKRCWRLQISM